jgi:adenylosuccinate synthase
MPVSVVVGGQYGSEGKGKVALELVRRDPSFRVVVRSGGTNSGHTAYSKGGRRFVLRQLPAASIDGNLMVVLPPGSYIDVDVLLREIADVGLAPSQIAIDPRAHIIRKDHVEWERRAGLVDSIGSTGSGTGAAVISRYARCAASIPSATQVGEVADLLPYVRDSASIFNEALRDGQRILIEGTQGYGLSPIHGDAWPKCTSRDTTAAAFLSEAGISPLHVDEIVLVLRCHPIRVAGDSGPLVGETSWEQIAAAAGIPNDLREFTSVTHKLRRVGIFDPTLVRKAIIANAPTAIVLNHLDHVDGTIAGSATLSSKALDFVRAIQTDIGQSIDFIGTDGRTMHVATPAFA